MSPLFLMIKRFQMFALCINYLFIMMKRFIWTLQMSSATLWRNFVEERVDDSLEIGECVEK